ncbi:Tuberculostearic acid methyltransferase UfaA1 [Porphyridium purpureum]|uniref:Tuberculostearic acid methyltransferase UfaA1 n=1 Tax=Porphyridium purpureum TaxID=35688 RepID=A0A5J4Z3E6_PORPP|nr:Tuberculostearic acid methyltransferase UfaA1 [Porphyridium purpureum]|eukprot:POR4963..scf295_1
MGTDQAAAGPVVGRKLRVAVIGSGVSGLAAAWHLQVHGGAQVTLIERAARLGGHANTQSMQVGLPGGAAVPVDTGFIVYNELTYPNLVQWFARLGVETEASEMSLSVSVRSGDLADRRIMEWSSRGLQGLLVQWKNLFRPSFYLMLFDMLRFNRQVVRVLRLFDTGRLSMDEVPTLREFLVRGRYSKPFIEWYLLPTIAAVWSCSYSIAADFPVVTLFRFFHNHRFAQIFGRPQWRTVTNRSRAYVDRVGQELDKAQAEILLSTRVVGIAPSGAGDTSICVKLAASNALDSNGLPPAGTRELTFDRVVVATHAPTALSLLATHKEFTRARGALAAFQVSRNKIVIHTDQSFLPVKRHAWSSWNVLHEGNLESNICVTYWNNRLQNLPADTMNVLETLNPIRPIDASKVLMELEYDHPQYTVAAVRAQKALLDAQGEHGVYYCGAYTRYGFHEDGLISGLSVAQQICGVSVPWDTGYEYNREQDKVVRKLVCDASADVRDRMSSGSSLLRFCRSSVRSFMRSFIFVGRLTIVEEDCSFSCGQPLAQLESEDPDAARHVILRIVRPLDFYVRILTSADIGLAEAYIYGDFEVVGGSRQLTHLFELLISNRDQHASAGTAKSPFLSVVGSLVNSLVHLLWKRNTVSGSRKNIAAHYDLSNDLFSMFLGDSWTYSCALFEADSTGLTSDELDVAQYRKVDMILDKLCLNSEMHLLEIGCGWGTLAIRAAERFRCRVTGVTLSVEQLELANKRIEVAGLSHLIDLRLCDYRLLHGETFDRIVSVEMLEAVGHEFLGEFFGNVQRLLKPRVGVAVIQVITTPEVRYDAYRTSADFISKHIFPGCCCPSFAAMVEALNRSAPELTVEHVENIGIHYARTLDEWCARFMKNKDHIKALEGGRFDDDFIRKWEYYFRYCEAGFATRTLGDLQITLTYPGNTAVLGKGIKQL